MLSEFFRHRRAEKKALKKQHAESQKSENE
ncbi:Uncharacterised protein [Morganella morganii]|nr:Uncharacterised protein [Morganella morganii]